MTDRQAAAGGARMGEDRTRPGGARDEPFRPAPANVSRET